LARNFSYFLLKACHSKLTLLTSTSALVSYIHTSTDAFERGLPFAQDLRYRRQPEHRARQHTSSGSYYGRSPGILQGHRSTRSEIFGTLVEGLPTCCGNDTHQLAVLVLSIAVPSFTLLPGAPPLTPPNKRIQAPGPFAQAPSSWHNARTARTPPTTSDINPVAAIPSALTLADTSTSF
jgi:hypothetical protein